MDALEFEVADLSNTTSASEGEHSSETQLKFYIFGHNISHSLSPALHNAGFQELGLPYLYSIHESLDVDEGIEYLISRPDFGGASITYPHKLQAGRLVDYLSSCAAKVGAINTIVVEKGGRHRGRRLRGDNTDWLGILRCIRKSRRPGLETLPALVLGAGGAARAACHALQTLGISELTIVNRTKKAAEAVAKHFPDIKTVHIHDTLKGACNSRPNSYGIVIACVPAVCVDESQIPESLFSLGDKNQQGSNTRPGGVLIEMAYKPQITNMMMAALKHSDWDVFRGTDILEQQAYAQFEMWTGLAAPTQAMGKAMQAVMKSRGE